MLKAMRHGSSEPGPSGDRRTVPREPPCVGQAGNPEREGLLAAQGGKTRIGIVVPTDRKNLAWRAFYGFWSAVGAIKTAAPTVKAIRANDGGTLMAIVGTSALIAPIVGIGLAAVESIVVAASFVATAMEKRQTARALKQADRRQLEAIRALVGHVHRRREEATRQRCLARLRPSAASILEEIAPDEAGARAPGEPLLPAVDAQTDAQTGALQRAAHDAIVDRMLSAARDRDAHGAVVEAGLTLSRDTVVQGALVGSATAETLKDLAVPLFFSLKQAALSTPILSAIMGAAHMVTGSVSLWRALRNLGRQNRTIATFSAATRRRRETLDGALSQRECKHKHRIASHVGTAVLNTYEQTRRDHRGNAIRSAVWSGLRILYGAGSAALGITSLAVLLGLVTGGAAIPIVIAALGTGWLLFAGYRLLVSKRMKAREQREATTFAEAMHDMTGHADLACGLRACTLPQLESLPSLHPLLNVDSNTYYRAALFAKYLHIEGEAYKNANTDIKAARLQTSAALQLIGIPREVTQLLKRSSIETSYAWIVGYLGGNDNRALVDTDPAVVSAVAAVRKGDHDSLAVVAAAIVEPRG